MPLQGEYQPSPWSPVADQVALYEATDGKEGGTLEGKPVVILTTRGRKSGARAQDPAHAGGARRPLRRGGVDGGAPKHPVWYLNLLADPRGHAAGRRQASWSSGRAPPPRQERADWWPRATEAWPAYDDYQKNTERQIPVVILEPV